LQTVILQSLAWQAMNLPPLRIAINVSAQQVQHEELVNVFGKIVKQSGIDPSLLELEITESAFIDNDSPARETLNRLKKIGFTIALDDFGTGYSSLSYLKRLPIDVVKIDKSFIRDIATDSDSTEITNAIVVMAKSLKLKVIAEGVETHEQLSLLRSLGCTGIQGYLFSRPVSVEAVTRLLQEQPILIPGY
jgi:EAL domain-containing protein (putative c-di-GMP-specific phosphodiesterase class I)